MKRLIISIMLILFLMPTIASAHGIHDRFYDTYPKVVERWRPFVVKMLKEHKVYTRQREHRVLNIIAHENGGSPYSKPGRICVGLLQFDRGWIRSEYKNSEYYWKRHGIPGTYRRDGRTSAYWSIHRITHVYKDGGDAEVKDQWEASYYLGEKY